MGKPAPKGHPKWGGRKKGTPNKVNAAVREIVEQVLGKTIPERLLEIARDRPREEPDILMALLPYSYPKLAQTQIIGDVTLNASEEINRLVEEWEKLDAATSELMAAKVTS